MNHGIWNKQTTFATYFIVPISYSVSYRNQSATHMGLADGFEVSQQEWSAYMYSYPAPLPSG